MQHTPQCLLWFLNHNHVFTQGTSAKNDEILNSSIIDVIKTNRGGKTTYHGPGQRIVYFMLNLNNKKLISQASLASMTLPTGQQTSQSMKGFKIACVLENV